jgi:hypothetical protein
MDGKGWSSAADVAFGVVLLAVVFARWREYRAGGQTADGQPVTSAQVRRFTIATLGMGIAVWAVTNAIGNYWMVN